MQAIGRQPQRAPDGASVHYEHHVSEQTALYRLVQQHAATFVALAEAAAGADLPQFVKDEFDVSLECGILAHGFLRLRCGDCGQLKSCVSGWAQVNGLHGETDTLDKIAARIEFDLE